MAAPWQPPAPANRDGEQWPPMEFVPYNPLEAQDQYPAYPGNEGYAWAANNSEIHEQGGTVIGLEEYSQDGFAPSYYRPGGEPVPWQEDGEPKLPAQVSTSEHSRWGVLNYERFNEGIPSLPACEETPGHRLLSDVEVLGPPVTGPPYAVQSQDFVDRNLIYNSDQFGWSDSQYRPRPVEHSLPLVWDPYIDQPPALVHEDSLESRASSSTNQAHLTVAPSAPGPFQAELNSTADGKIPVDTVAVSADSDIALKTTCAVSTLTRAPPKLNNADVTKRPASFDECVTIFETTPGAITKVKRRKKLDPDSHKSFKVTRKIGACLECRFRKRTCSPGSPCEYCVKVYGSTAVAEVTCKRESPFSGNYCVTDYFILSSKRRIVDFNIKGKEFESLNRTDSFVIHGKSGPCDLPLTIPVAWQSLDSLSLEDQSEVWRTKQRLPDDAPSQDLSEFTIPVIPEDDEALGNRLENWAIIYASTFAKLHGKRFPTAHAFHVGMVYVEKRLPEYQLVYQLLRGIALAYVLRAGVKVPSTQFRTIQARIDTVIYQRLRRIELGVFAALQKIVWVSAGRLKREQCYPVAYVLWQTMRSTCLRASHVKTLLDKAKGVNSAEYRESVAHLTHCFNLLLSVHTALFRSNSPIILDYKDPANHDLLNFDEEFIREAAKLRNITLNFHKGSQSKPFRDSNWYHTNMSKRLMRVLSGKGAD